jgi:hypothetical protein
LRRFVKAAREAWRAAQSDLGANHVRQLCREKVGSAGHRVTRCPISMWEMTVSILSSLISLAHIPHRYPRMIISIW